MASFAGGRFDGNCIATTTSIGSGGLMRMATEDWVARISSFDGKGDALYAELSAIKNGLTFAWSEGHRNIHCETDSLKVVNLLQDGVCHNFHKYSTILGEIRSLLNQQWLVHISHVYKEANACADYLAKFGATQCLGWKRWKDLPPLLGSFLFRDKFDLVSLN